ncbi:DUF5691 domain-containing protein [Actinoplanes rectilineatus]|uniref:DUF5691 domain-containing protein n=1 Tax=Actinoplanes rectilineatus TaxID=113571 RepID=UPI000696A33A|nr:DUF5691 domain-containing protein [Actinoplanes rectilineatus]
MSELGRWLDDQVLAGLAGLARSGRQAFEPMAARLVDAQAPGAAAMVRRLGDLAGTGPQWADRMLGEMALLRLLVSGHERLALLDPATAATVRARIGFPTTAEEVLAGPHVVDQWQVLGRAESEDGVLTTRRTWLHGVESGRFALVMAFAAPGRPLVDDLVPGTGFRGGLAFHPGSGSLRALVAERFSAAEPFGAPAGGGSIRAGLSRWASFLSHHPWGYESAMLLADVTPGAGRPSVGDDGGHLVDAEGAALPLAPGFREPWWLLAAAGGRPATVAAEWSPDGLRPLAAWVDGEFVPVGAPAPDPGAVREPELPAALLAAALVGTGRRPWTGDPVRSGSSTIRLRTADESPVDGAGGLLAAAAVALVSRRAGILPGRGRVPVPAAPPEDTPLLPAAAGRRLALILNGAAPGGGHLERELLAQWLAAAADRGGRVPPVLLPALLTAGRRDTSIRAGLARVAGRRGRWLAAQRPEWQWLLDEAQPGPAGDWHTAGTPERLGHLVALRHTDPGRARELVAGTWDADPPEVRARFLTAFATGLTLDDEPLLENALDDPHTEVRDAAREHLRRLPGAALGRRMAERAHAAVRLAPTEQTRLRGGPAPTGRPHTPARPVPDGQAHSPERLVPAERTEPVERAGVNGRRLVVEPPREVDRQLRRDGVGAAPPRGLGAGAWLLEEVLAGTPLASWAALTPAGWLRAARGNDWAAPLLHGWARAAVAQRDSTWASTLLTDEGGALREAVRWDLHLVLPPGDLARLAVTALRAEDGSANRLLALHPGRWPDGLTDAILDSITARARTDRHTWQLGELCRLAAVAAPPERAGRVVRLAAELGQTLDPSRVRPVADLARALTFRHEMFEELR